MINTIIEKGSFQAAFSYVIKNQQPETVPQLLIKVFIAVSIDAQKNANFPAKAHYS